MLSREPYIYAAPRHLVITYLTPEGRKLLHARANGTSMLIAGYELRRISLLGSRVDRGKRKGRLVRPALVAPSLGSVTLLGARNVDKFAVATAQRIR
jgi:hypothetical protein